MVAEENVQIIIIIILTGLIIVPIFIFEHILWYIAWHLGGTSAELILWSTLLITILVLLGSLLGIIIGERVSNRVLALIVTLLINVIVAVITLPVIFFMRKSVWICYLVSCITTGMIGPILVLFIVDQLDMATGGNPLLYYNICSSYLLASMFLIYTPKILSIALNPLIFIIITIVCMLIALIVLKIITSRFKKYLIIKQRRDDLADKPTKPERLELLKFLVPAAALLVIINILGNSFQVWGKENFTYNRSFDEPVLYQKGYAGVFLIPLIVFLGLKPYPKLYIMLSCLSIFIAACLWPFVAKSCILKPDRADFGPEILTTTIFNQRPSECILKNQGLFQDAVIKEFGFYSESHIRDTLDTKYEQSFKFGPGKDDPVRSYDFTINCDYDVNYIIIFKNVNNIYDGCEVTCVRHRRHVSGYPTLGIVRDQHDNSLVVHLVHIETNTIINLTQYLNPDLIHIIQLLPGKWLLFVEIPANEQKNYTAVYDYKPGGFYYQQFTSTDNMLYIPAPKPLLLPYQCDPNTSLFNIMYWLLMFGKILIVTSTLVICIVNLEIEMKCVPLAGCFIFFHLSSIISRMLAIFMVKTNLPIILLTLLITFVLYFPFFTDLAQSPNNVIANDSRRNVQSEYHTADDDTPKPVKRSKSVESRHSIAKQASRHSIAKHHK